MFSHVTLGTHELAVAAAFYDAVLAPLGIERVSKKYPNWAAWQCPGGEQKLWVGLPYNQEPASVGNGSIHARFVKLMNLSSCAFEPVQQLWLCGNNVPV